MIALSDGHHALYRLSFPNGKGYIGVTTNPKRRLWEHSLGHVEGIAQAALETNTWAVCLLLPIESQTGTEVDDPEYLWLKTEIEARGVPVIDALPYLRKVHVEGWLPYDRGHLDVPGHRQVARALLTGLRELGIVP